MTSCSKVQFTEKNFVENPMHARRTARTENWPWLHSVWPVSYSLYQIWAKCDKRLHAMIRWWASTISDYLPNIMPVARMITILMKSTGPTPFLTNIWRLQIQLMYLVKGTHGGWCSSKLRIHLNQLLGSQRSSCHGNTSHKRRSLHSKSSL